METKRLSMDRRSFLGSAAVLGMAGLLGGCSPEESDAEGVQDEGSAAEAVSVDEEVDCDILIIGAGMSGLAAAVEAADQGVNAILIEASGVVGGNGNGVEASFGNGSKLQEESGYDPYNPGEIIRHEMESSQWRAYGPDYIGMINSSGENIDWLVEHGVKFKPVTAGLGTMYTNHPYEGGTAGTGYVPYMEQAAVDGGIEIRLNTKAFQLLKDDAGEVVGVLANDADAGSTVQFNAKAVIVATGSFPHDPELVAEMGIREEDVDLVYAAADCDGVAHRMCVDAGAASYISNSVLLAEILVKGTINPFEGGTLSRALTNVCPTAIWVNEYCERIVAEDFISTNLANMTMPVRNYKNTYIILDQESLESASETIMNMPGFVELATMTPDEEMDAAVEAGGIIKADTIADLAAAAGLDPDALAAAVDRYNGFCKDGVDADYAKDPQFLKEFAEGPFYLCTWGLSLLTCIGSIYTNSNFNALDEARDPIDGLYVVGVEGARLWASLYTIDVSGGCSQNAINSGRVAVRHAVANRLA